MSDLWGAVITTIGTLVGSFGGYSLAARSQRRADERKDVRAQAAAERKRSIQLEDERHEIQLRTLMELQDQVRRMARSTYLVVQQDRETITATGSYHRLPEELNADSFETRIAFTQNIARVTNDELRQKLVEFGSLCSEFQLPPPNGKSMDKEVALVVQERRSRELAYAGDDVGKTLGEHLRREIDRASREQV